MRISEEKIRKIVRKSIIKNIKEGDLLKLNQKSDNFSQQKGGQDVGKSLTPDTSASIKGSEFVVHGVKFQSEPAEGAGNMAAELYKSAEQAGQSSSGKKWETTPTGRQWIRNTYMTQQNQARVHNGVVNSELKRNLIGVVGFLVFATWVLKAKEVMDHMRMIMQQMKVLKEEKIF